MVVTPVLTLTVLLFGFVAFLVTGSMGRGNF
jgi:hypothetical protein